MNFGTGPEIKLGIYGLGTACTQTTEILRTELRSGAHRSGARMPSGQDLQDRFRVSIPTIYKALRLLAEEGLVEKRTPRGPYYVA